MYNAYFFRGGVNGKKVDSVHIQHFSPFIFYNFHGKSSIWKILMCTPVEGVWRSEKVYYLCTHLYVDNYGLVIMDL